MRKPALVAVTLLAALVLSGCTVIGSIADKAVIDLGLASLSSQLEEIPGVTEVTSTAEITPDYHYVITLHATADSISDADLLEIATLVSAEFGAGVFAKEQVGFDLALRESSLVTLSAFDLTAEQLAVEFGYLSALSDAYGGQLWMSLSPTEDGTNYLRSIGPAVVVPKPDWGAMRAVDDPSTAQRDFAWSGEDLPSPAGAALLDAVTELSVALNELEPLDDGEVYLSASVFGADGADVDLQLPELDFDDLTGSEYWTLIVAVAEQASQASLTVLNFSVHTSGTTMVAGSAHYGDCAVDPVAELLPKQDAALAETLGTPWLPGWCN